MKSLRLWSFVLAVDAAAIVALLALPLGDFRERPMTAMALVALGLAAGAARVRIPVLRTHISVVDPFILTTLALLNPAAACLTAVAAVLGAAVAPGSRVRPIQAAFNFGAVFLSAACAGWTFVSVGGVPGAALPTLLMPLTLSAAVFFLVNAGLLNAVVALEDRQHRSLSVWRRSLLWTLPASAMSLALSVSMLAFMTVSPALSFALALLTCWLLVVFFRTEGATIAMSCATE